MDNRVKKAEDWFEERFGAEAGRRVGERIDRAFARMASNAKTILDYVLKISALTIAVAFLWEYAERRDNQRYTLVIQGPDTLILDSRTGALYFLVDRKWQSSPLPTQIGRAHV